MATYRKVFSVVKNPPYCQVHYCIPAINVTNIHKKVVNILVEANGKRKALLEDAPSSNVYSLLQKLTAQNSICEYFSSQKVDFRKEFPLCILCETKSSETQMLEKD